MQYGVASRQSGWRLALCTGVSPNLLVSSLGSKWRCCRGGRALGPIESHPVALPGTGEANEYNRIPHSSLGGGRVAS